MYTLKASGNPPLRISYIHWLMQFIRANACTSRVCEDKADHYSPGIALEQPHKWPIYRCVCRCSLQAWAGLWSPSSSLMHKDNLPSWDKPSEVGTSAHDPAGCSWWSWCLVIPPLTHKHTQYCCRLWALCRVGMLEGKWTDRYRCCLQVSPISSGLGGGKLRIWLYTLISRADVDAIVRLDFSEVKYVTKNIHEHARYQLMT